MVSGDFGQMLQNVQNLAEVELRLASGFVTIHHQLMEVLIVKGAIQKKIIYATTNNAQVKIHKEVIAL